MSDTESIDVRTLVADIEGTVEQRRRAGEYSAELLQRLSADFAVAASADPPEAHAVIRSSRALYSARPGVGRAIVFGKRTIRRLTSWYIHPITEDQTNFNLAILRELRALEKRVKALEADTATNDTRATSRPRE